MRKRISKSHLKTKAFSGKLAAWLNDSLIVLKRREELPRIRVFVNSGGTQCYTDGFSIVIGMKFPLFESSFLKGAETTLTGIMGVVFHELGHVMYHHYIAAHLSELLIHDGSFWPCNPDNMSEKLKEYLLKGKVYQDRAYSYYHVLRNCLCDARGEHLMLTRHADYRRFAKGLELIRAVQLDSTEDLSRFFESEEDLTVAELAERKSQALFSSIVQTGKFGSVKGLYDLPAEHKDILDTLVRLDDQIAECVTSSSAEELYKALNFIYCDIFDDYILPYLLSLPDPKDDPSEDGEKTIEESLKDALGKAMESSADDRASEESMDAEMEYSRARDELEREAKESTKTKDDAAESKVSGSCGKTSEADGKPAGETSSEKEKATASLWTKTEDSTVTYITGEERESIACTLEAIERGSSDSGDIDSHEASVADALELSDDLDFGSINSGIDFIIERVPDPYHDHALYDTYRWAIDIGKNAARKLKRILQPVPKPQFERDRYSGTRIVQSKLSNPNLKMFAKRNSNPAPPTLSVAILIDESGSMRGARINSARAAAISLFEMCRALNVRYAVYGHTTRHNSRCEAVLIHNYCHFSDNKDSDKYKLLQINAARNNRDGAALRYVADQLHRETADRKLLIILSDGLPEAVGYHGNSAIADIRQVLKDYEHYEGYNIIAAIIGEPKDKIRAIYGNDRSIDIADLSRLPQELVRVVRNVV